MLTKHFTSLKKLPYFWNQLLFSQVNSHCFNLSPKRYFSKDDPSDDESDKSNYVENVRTLEKEIFENPEFDAAFPHLKKYKPETKVPLEKQELDFIQSLAYKYRNKTEKVHSDILSYNLQKFAEGFTRPGGPFKDMTAEQKEKVHLIADLKLQDLEEMDLTREDVFEMKAKKLGKKLPKDTTKKGLKLKDDPFFQYIKTNSAARELLVHPNESFTVEKIIDLALRQDVGIDTASSQNRKRVFLSENLTDDDRLR